MIKLRLNKNTITRLSHYQVIIGIIAIEPFRPFVPMVRSLLYLKGADLVELVVY